MIFPNSLGTEVDSRLEGQIARDEIRDEIPWGEKGTKQCCIHLSGVHQSIQSLGTSSPLQPVEVSMESGKGEHHLVDLTMAPKKDQISTDLILSDAEIA